MTYTEIVNDIQSYLGFTISSSSRVTSTEVSQWVNQDYRIAQSKMAEANINYYQGETTTGDVVSGTDTITLPDKFLKMKRFEIQYDDDEDKVRATGIDINDIYSTLDPENDPWSQQKPYYALWENTLVLKPTPDDSSSTWTTDSGNAYKLWFIEEQDDISGSSEPALPSAYHHLLSYGPTARGFRKIKKFDYANQYQSLWLQGLADMIAENTSKDKTRSMSFTITRGSSREEGIYRP